MSKLMIGEAVRELGDLTNGIDLKDAWDRFRGHRKMSGRRLDANGDPILMKMTFVEWLRIWLESGHWHERRQGKFVMSRHNDLGHYEVGNVSIKTSAENVSEAHLGKKLSAAHCKAMGDSRRGRPGTRHTEDTKMTIRIKRGTPVLIDGVWYPSIRYASQMTGIDGRNISKRQLRLKDNL